LHRDNFPPIFRKGSLLFLGHTEDVSDGTIDVKLTKPRQTSKLDGQSWYLLYAIQIFTMPAAIDHFVSQRIL
jgi:hypothetical protein